MIAALYVEAKGVYSETPGVVAFSKNVDERMYGGPWPVVAHPPCQRWGKLWKGQPGNIKKGFAERKGDDQGWHGG